MCVRRVAQVVCPLIANLTHAHCQQDYATYSTFFYDSWIESLEVCFVQSLLFYDSNCRTSRSVSGCLVYFFLLRILTFEAETHQ